MQSFVDWVASTRVSWFMNDHVWVWPATEILHFFGMSLLIGTIVLLDLRMLGMAKKLPLLSLHQLVPWGVLGFAINLITGILFFAGNPYRYVHNISFVLKLLFIFLAGINVLVFYLNVFRDTESVGSGDDAPMSAKIIAAISLFLWVGIMGLGRMITFMDDTF